MAKYDHNPFSGDGIPLLRDMIVEEWGGEDLPALLTPQERQILIEKLTYELQNTFRSHTYLVMHGILDGSPEQQDLQLFLRIRALLSQMLPEHLHQPTDEVNRDESES